MNVRPQGKGITGSGLFGEGLEWETGVGVCACDSESGFSHPASEKNKNCLLLPLCASAVWFCLFFFFPLVPLFGGRPADTSQKTKGFLLSTVFPTVHTYGKGTRCLSERGAGIGVQYAVSCRVMRPNKACLLIRTYLWYIAMVGRRQRPTYVSRVRPW
ncbi:hypothetical protein LX32DRAFT_201672 [Colletotrichum zoysiae]|uniref:Uncharacterized protein n=1 Tax=Colletotrichum zoysiae TaxID=1216348 RepID=A0AAD9LVQ2_9PEZI|nr:hypothetical protein LX32DRAFT_201672 [Colletotrichum zoysiae]